MTHNFEGFLDRISARQLEFISSVLDKQGFSDCTVVIETVGKAGDNFAADVRRIVAKKNGKTFKMVAKVAPTIEQIREAMFAPYMFINEHVMYTKVLPRFTELEKQVGVPESERLVFATCFGTLLEEPNEIILLEDLQVKNYVMFDRFKPLSDDAVKLILKTFAKLHSYSFVLRNKEPESFKALTDRLICLWNFFTQGGNIDMMIQKIESDLLEILDDEKYKTRLRGLVSGLSDVYKETTKDTDADYCVVVHGDGWTNNILFKLQGDDSIQSCCMIDYQLVRIDSPVVDIGYMIYNCTNYASRKQYYDEWIGYYYHEFEKSLGYFGLEAKSVYSKDHLEADTKKYAKLTIAQAVYAAFMQLKESGEAVKFKEAMETSLHDVDKIIEATRMSNASSDTIHLFKEKIEGIVNTHIDLGYI